MVKYFLYSQQGCDFCDELKKELDDNNIKYTIKDVFKNRIEWEKVKRSQEGIKYTPTLVVVNKINRDVKFLAVDRDFDTPEELINLIKK
jgi:glutaredoxin|tara:strand:+ start:1426 stop:1692 length:267 start_codon:yes stop_codon:yes gene_type:complete